MKILIYSPYIGKHFGGGEKYLLDCANILQADHDVSIGVSQEKKEDIKKAYEKFFDINLEKIKFIASPLFKLKSFLVKLLWTKQFDVIIYETDGSLFFSLAKRNILHIQTPLILDKSSLLEKLKLKNWQIKNTNSKFTKKIIEKYWQTKINLVHYPMVEAIKFNNWQNKKQKIILNVGRFFSHGHSKRQDVLVDIFKNLQKQYPVETKDWQLVLIGGIEDENYAKKIMALAKNYNIQLIHKINRKEILEYYKKASIYWHATGYDTDQEKYPEKVEHFGISTVEAMTYACVPIVIDKGGQPEILGEELKALLWETKDQCIEKTIRQIKNHKLRINNAEIAMKRAKKFSRAEFKQKLLYMIGENT